MKVILLQDVENLGKKYDIKEVKPGFARNFLIPKKMAKLATKQNLKWLESQKEAIEKEAEEDLKKSQELASRMDGIEININVKVGEEGQLFESINNVKIADKLKEMGFDIKKSQVKLQEPIKETGEFPVKVSLDHNLETEVTLIITGEGEVKEEEDI